MPAKSQRRSPRRSITRLFAVTLILAGIGLLGYAGLNKYYYDRALKPSVADAQTQTQTQATPAPSRPVRVTVGSLIDTPLEAHTYQSGNWSVAANVGSYLIQSALPGQPGNIILYGHNKQHIFGRLVQVKPGDTVTLTLEQGGQRSYRVTSIEEVDQSRTDVLASSDHEVLTMYTCTGWLDRNRFIVKAEPV